MNERGRIIVRIGLFLILLGVLFPSWKRVGWASVGQKVIPYSNPAGRHFLLVGPQVKRSTSTKDGLEWPEIEAGQLIAEISLIVSVTAFILTFRREGRNHVDPESKRASG